jgi:hypothetical protein
LKPTRLIRFALAILFLASTTIGAGAGAHAACDQIGGAADHASHGHSHDATSHQHGDAPMTDDGGVSDDLGKAGSQPGSSTAGTNCHGGVGCPGCVSVAAPDLPAPSAHQIAFRPTAESGQSAEPDTQLRPPKAS